MITSRMAYVYGPLIRELRDVGYTDRLLAAAPYDWRLPPSSLEARDGYFSRLVLHVEQVCGPPRRSRTRPGGGGDAR